MVEIYRVDSEIWSTKNNNNLSKIKSFHTLCVWKLTRIHRSELKSFHTLQQTEFMLLFTTVNIQYTKIGADISRDLNINFRVIIYEDIEILWKWDISANYVKNAFYRKNCKR